MRILGCSNTKMNLRLLAKQRLLVLCVIVAVIISAVYLKLHYIEDNYEGSKLSSERCFTELTSTKYQLNIVTEYKNRIDKLLTEMEKKHQVEKEQFRDVMDSCVAMKQQSVLCQSQFEDLQSECKKVKEDYDKLVQERDKAKPTK